MLYQKQILILYNSYKETKFLKYRYLIKTIMFYDCKPRNWRKREDFTKPIKRLVNRSTRWLIFRWPMGWPVGIIGISLMTVGITR